MLVNTSIYDFLCAFYHVLIFHDLEIYLKGHFGVTKKEETQFEYLSLRITQSQYGVSYDQSEQMRDNDINYFFPPDKTAHLKTVHTPFRTEMVNLSSISLNNCPPKVPSYWNLLRSSTWDPLPRLLACSCTSMFGLVMILALHSVVCPSTSNCPTEQPLKASPESFHSISGYPSKPTSHVPSLIH